MKTLYHIVPKNDGYHFLACSLVGKHYLVSKMEKENTWAGELIFNSVEEAQEYIDLHEDLKDYIPEKFWKNFKYIDKSQITKTSKLKITPMMYCPDCGHSLRCMCTIGADESHSQFTESLYHCENCLCDYNIARDSKGNFVKMTRHFWG